MTDPSHPVIPSPVSAVSAPPDSAHPGTIAAARESWRSEELLGEKTEVLILHGNEIYRLRRTRQGKLILYK